MREKPAAPLRGGGLFCFHSGVMEAQTVFYLTDSPEATPGFLQELEYGLSDLFQAFCREHFTFEDPLDYPELRLVAVASPRALEEALFLPRAPGAPRALTPEGCGACLFLLDDGLGGRPLFEHAIGGLPIPRWFLTYFPALPKVLVTRPGRPRPHLPSRRWTQKPFAVLAEPARHRERLGHLFAAKRKVFFAPDQHLCANTAHLLGLPADAVALWRRALDNGGLDATRIRAAKAVAWDGCCPIHAGYTPGDVATARTRHPGAELLIHPEAPVKVAALAEAVGSTKAIIEAVSRAEPGTHLLIGTEEHLVRRLAAAHPDLDIHPLRPIICQDMGRTTPEALLRVLQAWPDDTLVRVPDALLPDAHACVQRMLALA